jgi:hypothetical protein
MLVQELICEETFTEMKMFSHSFQIERKTKTVFEKGDPVQSTETAKKIYRELFSQLRNNRDWRDQTQRITVKTWAEATLVAETLTYFLGGAEVKANSTGEYNIGSKGYYHYIKL